jgi:transcriptional regulator with XRE-family HTH domain
VAKKPGNRLRVLRAEKRLTQLDVAKRLGISQSTYCLIESEARPPTDDERAALVRILKVEEADLGFKSAPTTEANA